MKTFPLTERYRAIGAMSRLGEFLAEEYSLDNLFLEYYHSSRGMGDFPHKGDENEK